MSKLKIKTITCHNVYNYGASLQEYALLKYLNNLGYESETINYNPEYFSNKFNMFSVSNPKYKRNIFLKSLYLTLKLPRRILNLRRKSNFDKFSDKYIKTSIKSYRNNDELKSDLPIADAYICGSDQIWNSFFPNGKDAAFYLDFVPLNKRKISYAASFAIEEIEEKLKPFVYEKVKKLDYISVRESSGVRILDELNISNVSHVCDPVFLLKKEEWDLITSDLNYKKPYILVYDMDNNSHLKEFVISMSKKNNWDIITISENINYAHKNYYYKGPDVFLSLIKNASFVVSNSFHAVAFSLIYEKSFVVFNRNIEINTRMNDLLELLELKELMLAYDNRNMNISTKIDFNSVKLKLNDFIESSQKFIKNSIMDIK